MASESFHIRSGELEVDSCGADMVTIQYRSARYFGETLVIPNTYWSDMTVSQLIKLTIDNRSKLDLEVKTFREKNPELFPQLNP